jgi:hypothetical protein
MLRRAGPFLLALAVVACGNDAPPTEDDLRVEGCGLVEGIPRGDARSLDEISRALPPPSGDLADGLAAFISTPLGVEIVPDDAEFVVTSETGDAATLWGRAPDGRRGRFNELSFVRADGVWEVDVTRGCGLRLAAPGWVAMNVLQPVPPPDPGATTFEIEVSESACNDGRPPTDREIVPIIDATADAVNVLVLVEPHDDGGFSSCPSNPPVSVEVTLDEPIGDRPVLDGSSFPPVEPMPGL